MKTTLMLVRAAVIAALYAVVTLLILPFSFGPIQLRISEALTILPLFYFEAIPGLAIGCLIANMASGPIDMVLGTLATLIAASLTFVLRKIYLGVWPPIIINALVVPLIFLTIPDITTPYFINVLTVGAGQLISVLALGIPLYFGVKPLTRRVSCFLPYSRIKKKEEPLEPLK